MAGECLVVGTSSHKVHHGVLLERLWRLQRVEKNRLDSLLYTEYFDTMRWSEVNLGTFSIYRPTIILYITPPLF